MMACHIIHQVRISLDVRRFIMKCTFRFLSCSAPSSLTIAIGKSFRHGVLLCTCRSFSRFSNFFASRSPPLVTAGKDLCLLCSLTRARASVLTRPCDVFLEAWSNASQHYRLFKVSVIHCWTIPEARKRRCPSNELNTGKVAEIYKQ